MSYAPIYPHDGIKEIGDDIFMVPGSIKINPVIRFTRNMAIIRHGGELSLVNPLRLNDEVEKELLALGEIKHIVRLGQFHGIDDPYYSDRFKVELWALPGGTTYPEPPLDRELSEGGELPFPGCELFCFQGSLVKESALLVRQGPGLLLTCDAIQHYGAYPNTNFVARLLLPFLGFPKTTLVGPIWLKMATPDGKSLRSEFDRLLSLEFDRLSPSHGTLIESGAHAAVAAAVEKAFGPR